MYKRQGEGKSPYGLGRQTLQHFWRPTTIRFSSAIVVTDDYQLLTRGRRPGQYTKYGPGGGGDVKTLPHLGFAIRNGCRDEFGIAFDNPAILDISPPLICIEAPHASDRAEGRPWTAVAVQFIMVDHTQIRKVSQPRITGGHARPTTDGNWGHWQVGNRDLRCQELIDICLLYTSPSPRD